MGDYQHIIVYGNPSDGFRFIGPFSNRERAENYLDTEISRENMWIAELDEPAGA
jgi:translation initiation factor RLI1